MEMRIVRCSCLKNKSKISLKIAYIYRVKFQDVSLLYALKFLCKFRQCNKEKKKTLLKFIIRKQSTKHKKGTN